MNKNNKRRVVVTGLGVVAPNAVGKDNFWQANINGVSGVECIKSFDTSQFATKLAAEVKGFDPLDFMSELSANKIERFSQLAVAAARLAEKDSRIDLTKEDPDRMGVVMGFGLGGMFFYEKQILTMQEFGHSKTHPASVLKVMPNAPSSQVSIELKLKGPNLHVSTACSSGSHALGQAMALIEQNKADVIFAGGTEAPICYYCFAAFDALRVMTRSNDLGPEASRPFDNKRDGFVLGEGAGMLVLEEMSHAQKRHAKIYAEIVGHGLTSSAHHVIIPDPSGKDAAKAITMALDEAGLTTNAIDYINAHGTGTQANDKAETLAVKKVFGKRAYDIPISSTKSMIGHTIGAAGAIEAVLCCLAMENNIIPPTVNYRNKDRDCDLDYVPNEARAKKVDIVLSNSFAFGGNNSTLILRKVA